MAIGRLVCMAFLAVAFGAARGADENPQPAQPGSVATVVKQYHRLHYLVVTPDGPEDGGDFGPKTPGTKNAGIQEALHHAKVQRKDVYLVGGGFPEAFKGGVAYRLDETLHVPWMQQFRLDGGEYQIHYTPREGD